MLIKLKASYLINKIIKTEKAIDNLKILIKGYQLDIKLNKKQRDNILKELSLEECSELI